MSHEHDPASNDNRSMPTELDFVQINMYVMNLIRQSPYAPACHHDSEDIAQEVQFKLARVAARHTIHNLDGYLYRAVRNECISFLRKRQKELPTEDIELVDMQYSSLHILSWIMTGRAQDPALLYELRMNTVEFLNRMCEALLKLPKAQRNAILCYTKRRMGQGEHVQLLMDAFRRHNLDSELASVHWPAGEKERQAIRGSYFQGRHRLARMLGIPLTRRHTR